MLYSSIDRRLSNRRRSSGGGRRSTDLQARPLDSPTCTCCRASGVAALAGESDGGWWFVCLACDALWDQRHVIRRRSLEEKATAAPFWRRLAFRLTRDMAVSS